MRRRVDRRQTGHDDVGIGHVVHARLCWALVVRLLALLQAETALEEALAHVGVAHRNGGMVDAEEQLAAAPLLPVLRAAILRKSQQLERMTVEVAELERLDAARQRHWTALRDRREPSRRLELRVGLGHVRNDDREVLEPKIGAGAPWRVGSAERIELQQHDFLIAQRHGGEARHRLGHAHEVGESGIGLATAGRDEIEGVDEEALALVEVGHDQPEARHAGDRRSFVQGHRSFLQRSAATSSSLAR